MARFEDYVKDDLESEINDAQEQTQDRKENSELPERFQGKSAEEIAESYVELEQAYSRQGNDMGVLRQSVDQLLDLQSQTQPAPEQAAPVTVDDFYEDPDATMRRVAREETGTRIEQLEAELAKERVNSRVTALTTQYPNWKADAGTAEFKNWVFESPYRQRLAAAADGFDMDAANDLMGLYYDAKGIDAKHQEAERETALRNATLESSSPVSPDFEETFSRSELMDIRIAAGRGDPEAQTYLKKNDAAIKAAYNEGNLTD